MSLKRFIAYAFIVLASTAAKPARADAATAEITYVSAEGVYFAAGTDHGVAVGDTLEVARNGSVIARIVVSNISSKSAAATILSQDTPVKAGDSVNLPMPAIQNEVPDVSVDTVQEARTEEETVSRGARFSGEVALSSYWHHDLTDSELDWTRPGLSTRFRIDNIGDAGIRLDFRHRTRLYHRSRTIRIGQDKDEWSNQVYEFALTHEGPGVSTEWGVGRVLAPYVRGIGFIDGAYVAQSLGASFKLGAAAGAAPGREDGGVEFTLRKFGVFAAYEPTSESNRRFSLSAAISSEYDHSTVGRDFMYFQTTFSQRGLLSTYHSVELDLNRDWRFDRAGERVTFTNYYGTLALNLHQSTQLTVSYDTRKAVRYAQSRHTPDSLFDDRTNKGFRSSLSVRLSDRISVRTSGGIRFRDDFHDDVVTGSFSIRASRFPWRRHSVSLYFSYINTQFTTGYRPMLVYRFPLTTRLPITLAFAGHQYETNGQTTRNYYGDVSASYAFRNGLFFAGSFRQYLDDELQSTELYTELGWRW